MSTVSSTILLQNAGWSIHPDLVRLVRADSNLFKALTSPVPEGGIPCESPCGQDVSAAFDAYRVLANRLTTEDLPVPSELAANVVRLANIYIFG